jgi:hypothetical protein
LSSEDQIKDYIAGQPAPKQGELQALHELVLRIAPGCELWFLDGRNDEGKIVSNPNIGYGRRTMKLAGGKSREFYRVGLSANTSGISVYVMGLDDKTHLARAYGERLGKASVTGYCVKFKSLEDVDLDVLAEAIRFGLGAPLRMDPAADGNPVHRPSSLSQA